MPTLDQKLDVVMGMIDMTPNGYFAVEIGDGSPTTFIRVSEPKVGIWKGCRKVQTQHGPTLIDRLIIYPTGERRVFTGSIVDKLMVLVVDWQASAVRYGQTIGKCCRCNTALTDERSRHYGIGPECEKQWAWVIEAVDLAHDGEPYLA